MILLRRDGTESGGNDVIFNAFQLLVPLQIKKR
jgi:hypothetical protein